MIPQPSFRMLRAAWIMARAFTPHAMLAPLALPWTLCSVIPGTLRGGMFLGSTRKGMVMLHRSKPVLDVLVLVPIMGIMFAAYVTAVPTLLNMVLPSRWLLPVFGGVTLAFMMGMVLLLPRVRGSMFPWGLETPTGDRWDVAGLAQLLGTRLTAIQLAPSVLDEAPPAGAVIVATANNQRRFHQYQRFGFTSDPRHRVHKVTA